MISSNNKAKLPRIGIIRLGTKDNGRVSEADHFLFDIQDKKIRDKVTEVYGAAPKLLNVTFHSNEISSVYKCELQRWGTSKTEKPYLMCAGDGTTAKEHGKGERTRVCPCSYLGNECRKKTMLRFLIPDITMGGTFLLVTKSEHSTRIIETTLHVAERSGPLIMRPFKLMRTEGFANIKDKKIKKYFVALVLDEAMPSRKIQKDDGAVVGVERRTSITGFPDLTKFIPSPLPEADLAALTARKEQTQLERDRERVKLKLKIHIRDPRADNALEAYACERFQKAVFDQLTRGELLILQHDLDERREVIGAIYDRILSSTIAL